MASEEVVEPPKSNVILFTVAASAGIVGTVAGGLISKLPDVVELAMLAVAFSLVALAVVLRRRTTGKHVSSVDSQGRVYWPASIVAVVVVCAAGIVVGITLGNTGSDAESSTVTETVTVTEQAEPSPEPSPAEPSPDPDDDSGSLGPPGEPTLADEEIGDETYVDLDDATADTEPSSDAEAYYEGRPSTSMPGKASIRTSRRRSSMTTRRRHKAVPTAGE